MTAFRLRHDVYALPRGQNLLLDVQSDLLDGLNTRTVVPLLPRSLAPLPAARLNPAFTVDGSDYVMMTQFIASIMRSELGEPLANLAAHRDRITAALNMLFQGF